METKLPEREIGICHRFREMRELLRLTHGQVAADLRITVHSVASYEYARAPIRWQIGLAFCKIYGVNQRWLATGEAPIFYYIPIATEDRHVIPMRLLFSKAYDLFLAPHVIKHLERLAKQTGTTIEEINPWLAHQYHPFGVGEISSAQLYNIMQRDLRWIIESLPQHLYHEFYRHVNGLMHRFHKAHTKEIQAQLKTPKPRIVKSQKKS